MKEQVRRFLETIVHFSVSPLFAINELEATLSEKSLFINMRKYLIVQSHSFTILGLELILINKVGICVGRISWLNSIFLLLNQFNDELSKKNYLLRTENLTTE